jgi:hypothetical protein
MDDRFLCNSQWQDLRFDMQLITPDALSASFAAGAMAGSGGAPLTAAGAGGQLMAAMPLAGAAGQAGAPAAVMPAAQVQPSGTSCATVPGRRGSCASALGLVIALALWRRRRGADDF